jgi:capsular polysaccharide transport system permease protein
MAVILRDMRTRFFNHGLGYLVVILWPLTHLTVIITISRVVGRAAPYGDSPSVFFATGLVPTLAFMYVSRYMAFSIVLNKPMMSMPIVKPLDILAGRAVLELIAACATMAVMVTILWLLGESPFPYNVEGAAEAYFSALYLGVCFGFLAGVITALFPLFSTIYSLSLILTYISSGSMFVANRMPRAIAEALSYNPVLECVEWMRSSYFPTYSSQLVSVPYIYFVGGFALVFALVLERLLRRNILEHK